MAFSGFDVSSNIGVTRMSEYMVPSEYRRDGRGFDKTALFDRE